MLTNILLCHLISFDQSHLIISFLIWCLDSSLFNLQSLIFQLPLHSRTWWFICLCIAVALVWLHCCHFIVVWLGVQHQKVRCKPLFINCFHFSVSTGTCHRFRSSSVDVLIESSIGPKVSSPSKIFRNKEFDRSKEASYLVVGEGQVKKEEDYVNYQAEDNGVNKSKIIYTGTEKNCLVSSPVTNRMILDKPETSSNSTTSTVAPSVSLSSSSAPHSVNMDCELKSPSSLHDSTISRLIDAVSLGNEQDTCGSISALIGQFESSFDHNNFTLSPEHIPSCHSNFRPKTVKDLRSPLKTNNESPKTKQPSNVNNIIMSMCKISQTDTRAPPLLSSPETAELEEVYTILDEEVLLPVSVYNLKKQTVHVQADTTESTPLNSYGSSPSKVVHEVGSGNNVGRDGMQWKRGSKEIEEAEERIYEEVYDPATVVPPQRVWASSKKSTSSFVNDNRFEFLHDSPGDAFGEVEINVDEDPLDMMLTSLTHGSQLKELISPTKRQAIYQNHESTPNYFQQKQPLLYHDPQHYPSHASHVALSQCPSPINQPSYQSPSVHQQTKYKQPLPLHRPNNLRAYNSSPLCLNSYHVSQSNCNDSSLCSQQNSYNGRELLNGTHKDRIGSKHIERDQTNCFQNGFSSSDSIPGQSAASIPISRDRGLYSLPSGCDAVISHADRTIPSSESLVPQKTQPHTYKEPRTLKQPWNQKHTHVETETSVSSQSNLGPSSTSSLSPIIDSIAPSPCKSKSLGDLTSEDISCNFQSKYHIISRSFITPHMRRQKRVGTTAEVTFQSQSCDPLTEQLRKLVSLEGDDNDRDRPQLHQLQQEEKVPLSQPRATSVQPVLSRDIDDSPPLLTRRLSSRSQSRVRHINSRARERQQEALKPRPDVVLSNAAGIGGVVLRNKPASQNPPANRHSTGSYIAGYLGQLEDRGLPEGACTSIRYGNGDHYGHRYFTDDSISPSDSSNSASEPEVYFLLRL